MLNPDYSQYMSKKCQIVANKSILVGNNVSHSNRKTRRRFLPNIQRYSLRSDILNALIRFKATPKSVRTIECKEGLDNYLLNTPNSQLAVEAVKIKARIQRALKKQEKIDTAPLVPPISLEKR